MVLKARGKTNKDSSPRREPCDDSMRMDQPHRTQPEPIARPESMAWCVWALMLILDWGVMLLLVVFGFGGDWDWEVLVWVEEGVREGVTRMLMEDGGISVDAEEELLSSTPSIFRI